MSDMRYLKLLLWAAPAAAILISGCGSRLPREIDIKRPTAGEVLEIDLSQVMFTDISTGENVNAGEYMDAQGKSHLLLTFGSRACSACNKKARDLRDRYLSTDGMGLVQGPSSLEVIGVNTDADPLTLTQRFVRNEGFHFIRWSDPRGAGMLRWFMPEGRPYGVPLTVLVSRKGILWSYTNDSPVTVDEIVERARRAAGEDGTGDAGSGGDGDDGTSGGGEHDHGEIPPVLAFPRPDRMRDVVISACDDPARESQKLAAAMPLDAVATFFHVEREECGETCVANRDLLKRKIEGRITGDMKGAFLFAASGRNGCPARSAMPGTIVTAREDRAPRVMSFAGGESFFEVFASHFDWNHTVREGEGGVLSLAPLAPAITLAFDRDGKLIFSAEGAIDEGRLDAFLRSFWLPRAIRGTPAHARGPAWNFHLQPGAGAQGGSIDYSQWREQSRFTVLNVFGESCGSCMAEMTHWSRSGGLLDTCAAEPEFCSFAAMENGLPVSGLDGAGDQTGVGSGFATPAELDVYLQAIRRTLTGRGINIAALMLDPYSPENDGGMGYLKRFFDGYLMARNPELGFDFRTIVADREGKILGVFKALPPEEGKPDHVEAFLEKLRTAWK